MNLHGTPACVGYESNLLCLLEGSFCHRRQSPVNTLGAPTPTPAAQDGLTPQNPSPAPRASLFWGALGWFWGLGKAPSEHPVVFGGKRAAVLRTASGWVGSGVFALGGAFALTDQRWERGAWDTA